MPVFKYSDLLFDSEKDQTYVNESFINENSPCDTWNKRYFDALDLPENSIGDKLRKYNELNSIHHDFVHTASSYARTIISEYFISDSFRSLHPVPLGGQGGVKYLLHGILFKLARGDSGPFEGNDENAAKAMGHEMKGGNSYFRAGIPGLNVALQVLIDYKGFRMHCQANLGISDSTLKVGSADAGQNVMCGDAHLLDKMRLAALELNLSPHTVNGITIYSACDVEGHVDRNNRSYLVDLARTFPPECPATSIHLSNNTGFHIGQKVIYHDPTSHEANHSMATLATIEKVCRRHINETNETQKFYTIILSIGKQSLSNIAENTLSSGCQSIFWRLLRPEFVKDRGRDLTQRIFEHEESERAFKDTQEFLCDISTRLQHESSSGSQCQFETIVPKMASLPWSTIAARTRSRGHSIVEEALVTSNGSAQPRNSLQIVSNFPLDNRQAVFENQKPPVTLTNASNILETSNVMALNEYALSSRALRDVDAHLNDISTQENSDSCSGLYSVNSSALLNDGHQFGPINDVSDSASKYETSLEALLSDWAYSPSNTTVDYFDGYSNSLLYLCSPSFTNDHAIQGEINSCNETETIHESVMSKTFKFHHRSHSNFKNIEPPPALSPDAFSRFSDGDPMAQALDENVREATYELLFVLIPAVAKDLFERGHPLDRFNLSLPEYLHVYGINLRHLGLLRFYFIRHIKRGWHEAELLSKNFMDSESATSDALFPKLIALDESDFDLRHIDRYPSDDSRLSNPNLASSTGSLHRTYSQNSFTGSATKKSRKHDVFAAWRSIETELLRECISRTLKCILKEMQREWLKVQKTSSEQGIRDLIVRFLNLVVGAHKNSEQFWSVQVTDKYIAKFGNIGLLEFPYELLEPDLNFPACGDLFDTRMEFPENQDRHLNRGTNDQDLNNSKPSTNKIISLAQLVRKDPAFIYSLVPSICRIVGIRLSDECVSQLQEFQTPLQSVNSMTVTSMLDFTMTPHTPRRPQLSPENFRGSCSSKYDNTTEARFEFVITDVDDVLPVIKHMHQLDAVEGLMLSLGAESKQEEGATPGDLSVALRLASLSTKRLHRAMTTVPDDRKTRHILADAYQIEGYAYQKLYALKSNNAVYPDNDKFFKRVKELQERSKQSFSNYARLKHDLEHTYCYKSGLSYREDIIGMVITIKHFKPSNGKRQVVTSRQPLERELSDYEGLRIEDVSMTRECYSLSQFLKRLRTSGSEKKFYRFFPLIIENDHAERAFPLLKQEIIRADCLRHSEYCFSLPNDHISPIIYPDLLELTKAPTSTVGGKTLQLPSFNVEIGFRVLSACANAAVVSWLTDEGKSKLSDEAIVGYIRLHHMLLYMAAKDDKWKITANKRIDEFLNFPETRRKSNIPNLGCFLIYFLVSDREWTEEFASVFFEESLARQVSWYLKDTQNVEKQVKKVDTTKITGWMSGEQALQHPMILSPSCLQRLRPSTPGLLPDRSRDRPGIDDTSSVASQSECSVAGTAIATNDKYSDELAHLENELVSIYRLFRTFEITKTSTRLLMFQVNFIRLCRRENNGQGAWSSQDQILQLYNASLGCPSPAMGRGLKDAYNAILNASDYEAYLSRISLTYTPQQMTVLLRNAIRNSVKFKYLLKDRYAFLKDSDLELKPGTNKKTSYASKLLPNVSDMLGEAIGWKEARELYESLKANGFLEEHIKRCREAVTLQSNKYLESRRQRDNSKFGVKKPTNCNNMKTHNQAQFGSNLRGDQYPHHSPFSHSQAPRQLGHRNDGSSFGRSDSHELPYSGASQQHHTNFLRPSTSPHNPHGSHKQHFSDRQKLSRQRSGDTFKRRNSQGEGFTQEDSHNTRRHLSGVVINSEKILSTDSDRSSVQVSQRNNYQHPGDLASLPASSITAHRLAQDPVKNSTGFSPCPSPRDSLSAIVDATSSCKSDDNSSQTLVGNDDWQTVTGHKTLKQRK